MSAAPVEHLGGEHVVEDLVAARLVAPEDPAVRECREHGQQRVHDTAANSARSAIVVRDLRDRTA